MASFDQAIAQAQPDQNVAAESLHDRHALAYLPAKRDFLACRAFGKSAQDLGLDGTEVFDITGIEELNNGKTPKTVKVKATKEGADPIEFDAKVRIDTPGEADYYRNGGILQYVLRNMLRSS